MSDVNINIKLVTAAAQAQLQQFNTKLKQTDDALKGATTKAKKFGDRLSSVGTIARGVFVGNLIQTALYGIVQAATDTTLAFAKFETQLVAIGKTTGLAGPALARLGNEFIKLSTEIPVAVEELLSIGTIAGQLGINGSKNIIKFTETIARLGASVEGASTEEFAKQLSRIAALTGVPIQEIDRLTSSLIGLGNNVKANEAEISAIALRLSAATKQFNLSAQDVLGLSATFAELGISAELGGSASLRIFRSITNAAATGGRALDDYVRLTGLTTEQFKELAKSSPVDVLTLFTEGLSKLTSDTAEYNRTLERLNLSELRAATAVSGLAGTYDRLKENVNRSRNDFKENTATLEESSRAFSTTEKSIDDLKNELKAAQIFISEQFNPALKVLISGTTTAARAFGLFIKTIKDTIGDGPDEIDRLTTAIEQQKNSLALSEKLYEKGAISLERYTRETTEASNKLVELETQLGLANGTLSEADVQYNKAKRAATQYSLTIEDLNRQLAAGNNSAFIEKQIKSEISKYQRLLLEEQKYINARDALLKDSEGSKTDADLLRQQQENARKLAIEAQFQEGLKLLNLQAQEEEILRNANFNEQNFAALKSYYEQIAELRFADQIKAAKAAGDETKLIELEAKKRLSVQKNLIEAEDKINKRKELNFKDTLGTLSTLQRSSSRELFEVGKAAAIAQATIDGQVAVQKALATGSPPFNFLLAALVGAATAVQIKNIASQSPPKFQDGGIVAGNNFSGDRVAARVNSGEMILNRAQQSQLFQLANGQGNAGQSAPQEIVLNNVIEIDGEAVFKSVSRQVADGKILGENQ